VARPQPVRAADRWLVAGSLAAVALATAISLALGSWAPAFGG
jgi:hypothetical protein